MTTEKATNPKNVSTTSQQRESKQELNQKTSVQFSLSIALGIITILLLAATSYYGLIRF
ncbi:MAG: hypothetical protein KME32_07630 [Mojavia pulchra JT2-VF2]|jgi:hypothetical protein|uniref:Uncharacterized protein n=1 Tax=Mojavia pulchra JT2-VF2 TaxID=287848 RepID=A0A951UF21_9NOST|nr:hypothetical protein [Mojavia pulchra JT2-VF2]